MYSDILTSCAESGKSSHLGFFLTTGCTLYYSDKIIFIPQPGLTLFTLYPQGLVPAFVVDLPNFTNQFLKDIEGTFEV